MMNYIFPILLILSFVCAVITGNMPELSSAVIDGATEGVSLLMKLLAMLCLWGGIMEIADKAGITEIFSKALRPLMALIFPKLKKEKYIFEAISMNITANILGLGNAATPLGLEAMRRMQEINPNKSVASDEMIVFVVMNTAAMHIIPTTVATLRGQYGSESPMAIMPASILTSFCALFAAVVVAKLGCKIKNRSSGGERLA